MLFSNRKLFRMGLVIALVHFLAVPAQAGGSSENVLLVVNADSASSKLIANYYIALRDIPVQNVVYLNGIPDTETTTLDVFRESILKPVFEAMNQRKIAQHIDYIVYSSDFPTAINIQPHLKKLLELTKNNPPELQLDRRLFGPVASINSLTYYAGAVMTDQPGYMLLDSNNYYRKPASFLLRYPFAGPVQKKYQEIISNFDLEADEFYQESIETLGEMAKQNPGQLAVAYSIAQCYGKLGDAKKSANWLQRAVKLGWVFQKQTRADQMFDRVKDDPEFEAIVSNIPDLPFDFVPTRGFKSRYGFGPNGMINSQAGQGNRHFLSTVLAVTRNQGNTEREALAQLQRSTRADWTRPRGKYYFVSTSDVRSTTRQPNFQSAIDSLKAMGYGSDVVTSKLPMQVNDIMGLMSGTPNFTWTQSGSKFLPGAIADNFTSFGGRMATKDQTKLSEFLKHGAAGASGTVTEPFSVQAKFPHPMIHVHYARGCTLAESFYQSVSGPTQLLIVGDALCRPFARPFEFNVKGLESDAVLKGPQVISFDAGESPNPIIGIQVFLDGQMIHQQPSLDMFVLKTADIPDGFHELRFVAIAANLIESTQSRVIPIRVDNSGRKVTLTSEHPDYLDTDTISFSAKSNWGEAIGLVCNGRMIAKESGSDVSFRVEAQLLGRGPVRLEAIAIGPKEDPQAVSSMPLRLEIEGRLSTVRRSTVPPKRK